VQIATPDGGIVELWSQEGTDSCQALLFTNPGVRDPGKPYRPGAGCGSRAPDVWETGSMWRATDGREFMVHGGHLSSEAVAVTLLAADGRQIQAKVSGRYYIVFTPMSGGDDVFNGLRWTDVQGRVIQERQPYAPGGEG
jgi:hypothetical protein